MSQVRLKVLSTPDLPFLASCLSAMEVPTNCPVAVTEEGSKGEECSAQREKRYILDEGARIPKRKRTVVGYVLSWLCLCSGFSSSLQAYASLQPILSQGKEGNSQQEAWLRDKLPEGSLLTKRFSYECQRS